MASRSALLRPAASCSTASAGAASRSSSSSVQLAAASRRSFALTSSRRAAARADGEDGGREERDSASIGLGPHFKTWLNITNLAPRNWFKSDEGERFKWPKEGAHNWIGGDRVRPAKRGAARSTSC